ncbi:hypothetical protein QUF63_16440 [Anaerolineales bacterium HSG25]|nr:hypothetical protein [Anaerolineales bacterium HSG25]
MRALIVAQTNLHGACCVGGLLRDTNENVRLMTATGDHQPLDTPYKVGQIWEIKYRKADRLKPPHIEDILVEKATCLGRVRDIEETLLDRVKIWYGRPNNLFESLIRFTKSGSGYVSQIAGLPTQSVGFWRTDKPLYKFMNDYDKRRYRSNDYPLKITYVGTDTPTEVIPADTLLRVSLARWWKPDNSKVEPRCYLQLSGWYL